MTKAPGDQLDATDFRDGIEHYSEPDHLLKKYGAVPAIGQGETSIRQPGEASAVFQTLLLADALRFLTLQMTAAKSSGHAGGFASQAEVFAAWVMLGQKNIFAEAGHHAPGFYSALFLDRSLERMGITTVRKLCERFRERNGLLGHASGHIPGILAPAGPLGQGQHFAMAAALLHRKTLFPVIVGDGGIDEPYTMSSFRHFLTAFPSVTNFVPVLVWNGFSQEHHSMVSTWTNDQMKTLWLSHGFQEVAVIDAKDFVDQGQPGPFVDSTKLGIGQRIEFVQRVIGAVKRAADLALSGTRTALVFKQIKGAGVHARGAKSHFMGPQHTLKSADIVAALADLALPAAAWQLVRTNCERAAGGPAAATVVTEARCALPEVSLPLAEYPAGERKIPSAELGRCALTIAGRDGAFLVANADGNEGSGLGNVNQALKILHPTADPDYHQLPGGQVYEPLSEDACAGLTASLSLMGGMALWCSYESFAVNGLPIWQTVTQAMAELRRGTPSAVVLLTATALEQGRNGWTHQRPELQAYLAAMMRNGNVFPLFPPDANSIQKCYEWALQSKNKGVVIFAGRTPTQVRTTFEQTQRALRDGAFVLEEFSGAKKVVLAVVGDRMIDAAMEAGGLLQSRGVGVRVVYVVSPRRLLREQDVAWASCHEPDGAFINDAQFDALFWGDALVGVTGGSSAMLEPVLLRSKTRRDILAWRRGETTAGPDQLAEINELTGNAIAKRAVELLDQN